MMVKNILSFLSIIIIATSCNTNDCEKNICLCVECGLVIYGLDIRIFQDDRNALLDQDSMLISPNAALHNNNASFHYTLPITEDGIIQYYSDPTPEVKLVVNHLDTIHIIQDYDLLAPDEGECCEALKLTSFVVNGLQYCNETLCPTQIEIFLD